MSSEGWGILGPSEGRAQSVRKHNNSHERMGRTSRACGRQCLEGCRDAHTCCASAPRPSVIALYLSRARSKLAPSASSPPSSRARHARTTRARAFSASLRLPSFVSSIRSCVGETRPYHVDASSGQRAAGGHRSRDRWWQEQCGKMDSGTSSV